MDWEADEAEAEVRECDVDGEKGGEKYQVDTMGWGESRSWRRRLEISYDGCREEAGSCVKGR